MSSRHATRIAALTAVTVGTFGLLGTTPAVAAQAPIGLGTAKSFAVLAGSGITNTRPTTITGDVGTFPTPSMTGFDTVTLHGVNHGDDAVTQKAKDDLVTAYNSAAAAGPAASVATELGGRTLKPGVYRGATLGITGTLTLDTLGDPSAVFVLQTNSTLITASASRVIVKNGGTACNVFWKVGSSATLGTGSRLVGTVMALTSISAGTGATVEGRLLARNGAVTLDTNTITRRNCAASVPTKPIATLAPVATAVPVATTAPVATRVPAATAAPATTTGTSVAGSGRGTGRTTTSGRAGAGPATPTAPRLPDTGPDPRLLFTGGLALALGVAVLRLPATRGVRRYRGRHLA